MTGKLIEELYSEYVVLKLGRDTAWREMGEQK